MIAVMKVKYWWELSGSKKEKGLNVSYVILSFGQEQTLSWNALQTG